MVSGGPGAPVLARILVEAMREGLDLAHVAVMAWNQGAQLRNSVRATIAAEQRLPPDLTLEDMIPGADPELIGSVCQVLRAYSYDNREPVTAWHRTAVADEFLELIKRASEVADDTADRKFLRGVRRQIDAAIRLAIGARLDEVSLIEAHRRAVTAGERLPAFSFVAEVADYFRDYKTQCDLADLADNLAARLEPVAACSLALIDEAGAIPPLGLRALRRLLPEASFVLAGIDSEAAMQRGKKIFTL